MEKVFCGKCMEVTDCKVIRGIGYTRWECLQCHGTADEDFNDEEESQP